jgi:hypothetical protein
MTRALALNSTKHVNAQVLLGIVMEQRGMQCSGLLSYYIYVINILPSYIQSSLFCYFIIRHASLTRAILVWRFHDKAIWNACL